MREGEDMEPHFEFSPGTAALLKRGLAAKEEFRLLLTDHRQIAERTARLVHLLQEDELLASAGRRWLGREEL
jgi:hypothetical protein